MNEILNNFMIFIETYKNLSYLILFLGAIGESLFPLSFFMYGEIFFLSGSILAGYGILNIYIVAPLLLLGGFIGDNTSYFIGKKYGDKFLIYIRKHKILGRFLDEKRYLKVEKFFKEKGGIGVLIARFSGPLARITPFIAGSFKLKYKTFIIYDIFGVIGGIGLFIFVGYVFGKNFEGAIDLISNYISIIIFIIILIISIYFIKKYIKNNQKIGKKKY